MRLKMGLRRENTLSVVLLVFVAGCSGPPGSNDETTPTSPVDATGPCASLYDRNAAHQILVQFRFDPRYNETPLMNSVNASVMREQVAEDWTFVDEAGCAALEPKAAGALRIRGLLDEQDRPCSWLAGKNIEFAGGLHEEGPLVLGQACS